MKKLFTLLLLAGFCTSSYSQIKIGAGSFRKKDKTQSSSSNSKNAKGGKKMSAAEMDAALKNAPDSELWQEIQAIGKSYRREINTAYPKKYIKKVEEWKTSNNHIENTATEYSNYMTAYNKKNGKKCDLDNAIYWAREDMKKFKASIGHFSNSASESKRYIDFGIKKAKEIQGRQSEYSAAKIKDTFNSGSSLIKNVDHAKFYAAITTFNGDKTAGDALYKKAEEGEKQIEAIRLSILDGKLAEVNMPKEIYKESDRTTLANGIKAHWKK
ncbi:MAG: hypothetical protein JKX84_05620, partial [Flavobacteriales bacterium]|nr:hypothetical protein [Flavobacteriales bacterium]